MFSASLADELTQILVNQLGARLSAILLYGSGLHPEQTDFWSDIDLNILLSGNEAINKAPLEQAIARIGRIVAGESHPARDKWVLRYVVQRETEVVQIDLGIYQAKQWLKNEQLPADFTILYGQIPEMELTDIPFVPTGDYPQEAVISFK